MFVTLLVIFECHLFSLIKLFILSFFYSFCLLLSKKLIIFHLLPFFLFSFYTFSTFNLICVCRHFRIGNWKICQLEFKYKCYTVDFDNIKQNDSQTLSCDTFWKNQAHAWSLINFKLVSLSYCSLVYFLLNLVLQYRK